MGRLMARIQVLPDGMIIGHILPTVNGKSLQKDTVYEVSVDFFDKLHIDPIGVADYVMPPKPISMDRFLAQAGGYHLTIDGGK